MRSLLLGVGLAICAALTCGVTPAQARTVALGDYGLQIESDGVPLQTFYHRGSVWAEGVRGQRYAIRVFNRSSERVEAVVTVDGRNVVSGQNGDYRTQRGYVINPWDSVLIEGFRRAYSDGAEVTFSDVGAAYASRMGTPQNIGVIGVAIFREKAAPAPIVVPPRPPRPYPSSAPKRSMESHSAAPEGARVEDMAGSSPEVTSRRSDNAHRTTQSIGTAYGDSRRSEAVKTTFTRQSQRPDARLVMYYDDHQGLVKRGVISVPPPRPTPDPFPLSNDPQFAPPPPGYDPYYRD